MGLGHNEPGITMRGGRTGLRHQAGPHPVYRGSAAMEPPQRTSVWRGRGAAEGGLGGESFGRRRTTTARFWWWAVWPSCTSRVCRWRWICRRSLRCFVGRTRPSTPRLRGRRIPRRALRRRPQQRARPRRLWPRSRLRPEEAALCSRMIVRSVSRWGVAQCFARIVHTHALIS